MKKIGVLANNYGTTIGIKYLELVHKLGVLPVFIPYIQFSKTEIKDILNQVDGLIIPGGVDISPRTYKEENTNSKLSDFDYDKWQLSFIRAAINKEIKIFGICRGHQLINIHFGGSLIQDIKSELKTIKIEHDQNKGKFGRHQLTHQLRINKKNKIPIPEWITFKDGDYVNSLHHQAITTDMLGKGLIPVFGNEEIVEVMYHESGLIFSVQFHPEEFLNDDSTEIFETLNRFFGLNNSLNNEREIITTESKTGKHGSSPNEMLFDIQID